MDDKLLKVMNIYDNKIFKDYILSLEELFNPNENYTFLVGAGISMGAPTNIPSAIQFVNDLIEFYSPEHDINILKNLKSLRYEMIVDKIQEFFDKDISFLNYLEEIREPNIIHYFLANSIISGNYVITTNFDYMIELALQNCIPEEKWNDIIPIITENDFNIYKDPELFKDQNKYLIYKIHGSKKNLITNESTKDSLITTITALGKNKGESVTFTVEEFKKEPFDNLTKERNLVIMGYSGSDDFDISPTLKQIPHLKRIIWIEHASTSKKKIKTVLSESEGLKRYVARGIDKILTEIKVQQNIEVIKITINTQKFLEDTLWNLLLPKITIYDKKNEIIAKERISFKDWIGKNLKVPSLEKKYRFSCEIFAGLGDNESVKKSAEIGLVQKDMNTKEYCSLCLGIYYMNKREFSKAFDYLNKSVELSLKIDNESDLAWAYINFGSIYLNKDRDDEKALEYYNKALEINKKLQDSYQYTLILKLIGEVYQHQMKYEKALSIFKESLKIDSETGLLNSKADAYFRIANLMITMNNTDDAYQYLSEAVKIYEKLGDHRMLTSAYYLLGYYYDKLGKYGQGTINYEKARKSGYYTKDKPSLIMILRAMAKARLRGGFNKLAWNLLYEALELSKNLIEFPDKNYLYHDIGIVYKNEEKYDDAIEYFEETSKLSKKSNDLNGEALAYSSIANCYFKMEQYGKAIEFCFRAKDIYEKISDKKNLEIVNKNHKLYQDQLESQNLTKEDLANIKPELTIDKNTVLPGEKIRINYKAPSTYDETAWIGLIPSDVIHNDEQLADEHDVSYYYLEKSTTGRIVFEAPEEPGDYDFRLYDKNGNGNEILSISFVVEPYTISLSLNKLEYKILEVIRVQFIASNAYADSSWLGVIPSDIPHNDYNINYKFSLDTRNLDGEIKGERVFNAPELPGIYDIRMFTGVDGEEISSITFNVKE
ncbi:MAG: tetratricopeptide repeat protein [Candidatus Lokiarchaeota archaeon]|nr:tetratricopeptide repeat protein [Candidatus Lokiarchaeota archaeon]